MESPGKSIKRVTSLFHVGVAVSDIKKSIQILEDNFGFKTTSHRVIEHEYIGNLIGVNNVRAEIAMLDMGNGDLLELIHWAGEAKPLSPNTDGNLSSPRIHHICVYVDNADEWHLKLSKVSEIELISKEPVVVPLGPNKGSKVFFALVLGEIYFEIFQKI